MLMCKQESIKLWMHPTGKDLYGTQAPSEKRLKLNYTRLLWFQWPFMPIKPGERQ